MSIMATGIGHEAFIWHEMNLLTTPRYSLHRVTQHLYELKCEKGIKRFVISFDLTCISPATEIVTCH